jgi:phenylalanyl-tRNA synthetase alpha chain
VSTVRLDEVRATFVADLEKAGSDAEAVEAVRIRYAGKRSGLLNELTAHLRELPIEEKRDYGRGLNELKKEIEGSLVEAKKNAATNLKASSGKISVEGLSPTVSIGGQGRIDVTLPGTPVARGAQHPVHIVRRRIEEIFLRMGYDVEAGPEVEDDWHNFEALNIPPDHPARDDQDTFYLPLGNLLRTHTSPVQARVMESRKPPIRIVVPGRVYRRDSDLRHSPMFHQLEGLLVDEGITVGNLKATLETFLHALFSDDVEVRLRRSPSRRPRSISRASSATRRAAACARARDGSRSSGRAWSTRGSSRRLEWTPIDTPALPLGSASIGSRCWFTAFRICGSFLRVTSD